MSGVADTGPGQTPGLTIYPPAQGGLEWTCDVERVTSLTGRTGFGSIVVYLIVCVVPIGAIALYVDHWAVWLAAWVLLFSISLLSGRVMRRRAQRREARNLEKMDLSALAPAERAVWRGRAGFGGDLGFDVAGYLNDVGPDGPRVLWWATDLPLVRPAEDPHEEIDLKARGMLGRQGKLWHWGILAFGLLFFMTLMFGSGAHRSTGMLLSASVWIVCLAKSASAILGQGWISAMIVSPGRVHAGGWRGSFEYERANSVLVVTKLVLGEGMVMLWRTDGRLATLELRDGINDPALHALLARWCYPAMQRERSRRAALGNEPGND